MRYIPKYLSYSAVLLLLVSIQAFPYVLAEDAAFLTLEFPGLSGNVEIWRDEFDIAHIRAENEDDLFFAMGYVTAVDRMFQLDGSRRLAQGRLSEVFGAARIDLDRTNRDIGFGRIGKEMLPNLDPLTRKRLSRYSDGINAYIEMHRGKPSLEFTLLGYEPEPWKVEDSLAILRLYTWWLSADKSAEALRTHLEYFYGADIALGLMPPVPQGIEGVNHLNTQPTQAAADTPPALPDVDSGVNVDGSNCWAVSADSTEDGYAIFASDPHLELFAPSTWYQVHIMGGDINVIGVTFPGLPGIPIGHNEKVAWGASNLPFDIQDYTILKIDPENPGRYLWGDEWLEFEIQEEEIYIGKGEHREVDHHQRLLSRAGFVLRREADYWALRWTGSIPNDDLTPMMNLMEMESAADLRDALEGFNCAPQSFIAADVDGHIAQVLTGYIPVRTTHDGLTSVNGTAKPEWDDMLRTDELPYEIDPPEGYLAHANNLPDVCVGLACGNFKVPYIYKRIRQLLDAGKPVDVDYIKGMQMDVVNLFAEKYVDYILEAGSSVRAPSSNLALALSLLENWDLAETEDSSAATLFHEWFVIFTEQVFLKVIEPYSYDFYEDYTHAMDLVLPPLLAGKPNPVLFKGLTSDDVSRLATDSLEAAVDSLNRRYGEGPDMWQWGRVHHTNFKHPSGVEFLLGAGDYPDGGSRYTIKVADFFNDDRYESTFGVSYRQVVEMRPGGIRGWWVLPPGNHGSTLSPHYRDQIAMWLKGEYADMWFYDSEIEGHCVMTAVFKPEREGDAYDWAGEGRVFF